MQQELQLKNNKVQGSLWGCFIGDALAMPCHWYYDLQKLLEDFQAIKKYEAPKDRYVGSYVVLSVLGQVPQGNLIGDVILHDRRQFYKEIGQYHYHHGMKAGENTLEARLMNLLLKTLSQSKNIDDENYRDEYVKFMTTPGTHNDTYANSAHRLFFTNWANQKSLDDCPSLSIPAIDSIDGLVNCIPIILASSSMGKEDSEQQIKKIIFTVRKSDKLLHYAFLLNELLRMILNGRDLRQAIEIVCQRINLDIKALVQDEAQVAGCPLEKSFPATLYYAYKYADNPNEALLASTNGGGENVSRGIVLGAIMGATYGYDQWRSDFVTGLVDHDKYKQSIDKFMVWLQDTRII